MTRMTTLVVVAGLLLVSVQAPAQALTRSVDCSSETVASVMSDAQPGDTIMITGTCAENVVVDRDGITLDGSGSAVIDASTATAAAITVIGHRNVTIKGLTVQDGLHGIRLAGGASAVLEGTIVATENTRHGVLVEQNSHVSVRGTLEANSNDGHGVGVSLGSSIGVQANGDTWSTVEANDNGLDGINVQNGSSARFGGGANIEATGNEVTGLSALTGSSVVFDTSAGGGYTGTFNDNDADGIQAWIDSSLTATSWDEGVAGNITAANNGRWGILVGDGGSTAYFGSLNPGTTSSLTLSGNSLDGALVGHNCSFTLNMSSTISGNGEYGIGAWTGAVVDLRSVTFTNNTDGSIGAGGSQLVDSGGNSVVSVHCFGSVGSHGDLACPDPAPGQTEQ